VAHFAAQFVWKTRLMLWSRRGGPGMKAASAERGTPFLWKIQQGQSAQPYYELQLRDIYNKPS
jgi:hypothetical protein